MLASCSLGCAHLLETKTIEKFTANLQKQDLEGLKASASEDFASRALRTASAMEDFEILRIPDGKISVVKVEEVSSTHKRVTVEAGESKKEVFYELTKSSSGKWVVDDIYLRQKKQGVEAYKAVSEQMDLLLTVREFLDAWDQGEREDVLKSTTPELRAALAELPPGYLARLTRVISHGRNSSKKQRPYAQLMEDTAIVRLPRKTGETLITLELDGESWQVSDVTVEAKDEADRLPSLLREALAVEQCRRFLAAYERNDLERLQELSTTDFYQGCLSLGNLKEVQLPSSLVLEHELKASLNGLRADMTLRNDREIVQVTLHRNQESDEEDSSSYRVSNVSIFDVATQQEMRLGALFTARAMGQFYLEALYERDVSKLRHSSTKDFSERVWKKLNNATMASVPLEPFDTAEGEIEAVHFDGGLTRLTARAGNQPVELLLREEGNKFLVDDIKWDVSGRPSTVKATLELMIPVRNFAAGIALARDPEGQQDALGLLQESSSRDFNRMIWTQTEFVPSSGLSADTFLNAPLKSLTESEGRVIVQLGDNRFGAVINLVKERELYAVDEVTLIAGPQASNRVSMRQELRTQLSQGLAQRLENKNVAPSKTIAKAKPATGVVQAGYEETSTDDELPSPSKSSEIPQELDDPEDALPIESWDEIGAVQTEPMPE
ncbi:MAG: hypothetical protein U0872_03405 [Planctomycetaceae bacterium]